MGPFTTRPGPAFAAPQSTAEMASTCMFLAHQRGTVAASRRNNVFSYCSCQLRGQMLLLWQCGRARLRAYRWLNLREMEYRQGLANIAGRENCLSCLGTSLTRINMRTDV